MQTIETEAEQILTADNAIVRQARAAGIEFDVLEPTGPYSQRIRVNGKEYVMSTHWRTYGRLDSGITIFQLLAAIANSRRRISKHHTPRR